MSDLRPGTSTKEVFFHPKNESMLNRILYADFQRRTGADISDKQKDRLVKTVRHYMSEVYSANGDVGIQALNKEVLQGVVPDYLSYLRRQAGPIDSEKGDEASMQTDVSTRFGQLQNERQQVRSAAPTPPDFRVSLEEDGPLPLSRFEEVKKQRELEAARDAEAMAAMMAAGLPSTGTSTALVTVPRQGNGLQAFVESDVDFRSGADAAKKRDEEALLTRNILRSQANAAAAASRSAAPPPDARSLLFGEGGVIPLPQRSSGLATTNPTFALPEVFRDRGPLPQDIIRPQDDTIVYRENEYNLFVYSADRDWVNNNTENRYSFSVSFDPANNRPGFGFSTATNIKFKNITRIEFVKATVPAEGCDILSSYNSTPTLNTDLLVNVLSFPYLQVRIPELDTNGYGTNDGLNNSFGVISYDAIWTADSDAKNNGYAQMIPKFLKCQKVFHPTPLATLQKLTFNIQRPDGTTVSSSKDTLDMSYIYMPTSGASIYDSAGFAWLWITCSTYFNKYSVSQGDRIQIKNVVLNATLAANANAVALVQFLTRAEGHLVSDIGIVTGGGTPTYADGANTAGYANSIIIRNSFQDPTTGATTVNSWVTDIGSTVNSNPSLTSGRLINLNHQVQIILRVITRDMDAASRLRPDNLQA